MEDKARHSEDGNQIQSLQMAELLPIVMDTKLPVFLLGDMNSTESVEEGSVYKQVANAGFKDVWKRNWKKQDGNTCCFSETLDEKDGTLSKRTDFVFYKGARSMIYSNSYIVGANEASRTDSGLWPSSHAGLVSHMVFYRNWSKN